MTELDSLQADVVISLHDQGVREYGGLQGLQGLRDEGALHGAFARAENKLASAHPGSADAFDLAAATAFGIASNDPLDDGNKRSAWAACLVPDRAGDGARRGTTRRGRVRRMVEDA